MKAEIIRIIPRSNRDRGPTNRPTIAFRPVVQAGTPAADDADTAPCEYVRPESDET